MEKRKGQQQTQEEEERNLLCAVHGRGGCRWLGWSLSIFLSSFFFFFSFSTWSFSFFLFAPRLGLYSPVFLSISVIFIFSCLVRELYRYPHNNNNTGVNPPPHPNNIYRRINMDIYALTIKTGDRSIDFLYRVLHPATKYTWTPDKFTIINDGGTNNQTFNRHLPTVTGKERPRKYLDHLTCGKFFLQIIPAYVGLSLLKVNISLLFFFHAVWNTNVPDVLSDNNDFLFFFLTSLGRQQRRHLYFIYVQ